MNLRVPCLALCLLSIAATGDPCDNGGSTGTSVASTPPGQNGSVCGAVGLVDVECCQNVDDPCVDDNDCCLGSCSGSNGDSGFGSNESTCIENEGCSVPLSSRCLTGDCACSDELPCCLGSCQPATIPGTSGMRCCLQTGSPCDAQADCCSLSCLGSGQCE